MALGRHMASVSPVYSQVPFHEPTLRQWLNAAIFDPDRVLCAIAETDGEIAGVFLACCGPMLISDSKIAYEQTLFVYEQFRGTRAAVLLDNAFEEWAKRNGCQRAQVGVSAGINDDTALKFYRKRGYKDFGAVLQKEYA